MIQKDSAEQMIDALRAADQTVTEEDCAEIELFHKGRALSTLVNSYGWDVLLEMLKGYVEQSTQDLLRIAPGHATVVPAHAAASAVADLYFKLLGDIQAAIDASHQTPAVVKRGYSRVKSEVPMESL